MPMDLTSLSLKEALGIAMAKEKKAEKAYRQLSAMVKNHLLKEKTAYLAYEEVKHFRILESIYKASFPHETIVIPPKVDKPWADPEIAPDAAVPELLEAAMAAELSSEAFYQALAQKAENRVAKAIYSYLAAMEHSHYHLVQADYELTREIEGFWELQEMSEGFLMTHMGT